MLRILPIVVGVTLALACPRPAFAQQSLTQVLSFLLTNRSIPTADFERDEQAALATRDVVVQFLQAELSSLPMTSPAGGFTYRLDPTLGATVRASNSFGAFFTERALTNGQGQATFGVTFSNASYRDLDNRNLRDGTLVATASRLVGDTDPFDAETVALRIQTQSVTVAGHVGVTDRFDVSAALPLVMVRLDGERVDTYRGAAFVQASAFASASGIGDLVIRGKYALWRRGATGMSFVAEGKLPTGDSENLLGGGQGVLTPRVIASLERDRIAVHGNVGYAMGGPSASLEFAGAVSVVGHPRLTVVAEIVGHQLTDGRRLAESAEPHPELAGIETIRLIGIPQATTRAVAVLGFRWNVASKWVVSTNVVHPLTTTGLNAPWATNFTLDYSIGR